MTDTAALEGRIENLETTIAHQDRAIEDLNRMVVAQWQTIDQLTRRVKSFAEQLQDLDARATGAGRASEPPPPHY